jgi:hypothetical protein
VVGCLLLLGGMTNIHIPCVRCTCRVAHAASWGPLSARRALQVLSDAGQRKNYDMFGAGGGGGGGHGFEGFPGGFPGGFGNGQPLSQVSGERDAACPISTG